MLRRSSTAFNLARQKLLDWSLPSVPLLETKRLLLRQLRASDLKDIFEYASDPEVSRYTLWDTHTTIDETRVFLSYILDQHRHGEGMVWAVTLRSTGKMVGTCGFGSLKIRDSRAELGFALSRKFWNQGLTTEAVAAVLHFIFADLKLNRVEARCDVDNVASARVLEKSGMRFEGILRQHARIKGQFRNLRLYSILSSEYRR
ncbi:MAG TPA: GNAT family N-acetyltransferase [Terriglobales bacterium]|nr:GNAT family N-acetyltransferase [Terriglobales bacterium]